LRCQRAPSPDERGWSGDILWADFGAALGRRMRAASLRHGVTPFTLAFGALALLLMQESGHDAVAIAVPLSTRARVEDDYVVGYYINQIPVPVRWIPGQRADEFLQRIASSLIRVNTMEGGTYLDLLDLVGLRNRLSELPFHQYQLNSGARLPAIADLPTDRFPFACRDLDPESAASEFHMTWRLDEDGEAFRLRLVYAPELYSGADAHRILGRFQELLHILCDAGDGVLLDVSSPYRTNLRHDAHREVSE
jgi:non-ribosomal peptide synthetase component F